MPPPALAPAGAPTPSPLDDAAVRKAIMAKCAGDDAGVHKDQVVQYVQGSVKNAAPGRTKDIIEEMIRDGELFTTNDAFHFAA